MGRYDAQYLALVAGGILTAWATWGFPADPGGTFAYGVGLATVPILKELRYWHKKVWRKDA